jgi:hypothetical protein
MTPNGFRTRPDTKEVRAKKALVARKKEDLAVLIRLAYVRTTADLEKIAKQKYNDSGTEQSMIAYKKAASNATAAVDANLNDFNKNPRYSSIVGTEEKGVVP